MACLLRALRLSARPAARRTLRPARSTWLCLLLVLICGSLLLSTTGPFIERASALLTHQQNLNNNLFGTTSLIAPGNLGASPHGHDIALKWSAGQNGAGYEVFGVANGNSGDCTSITFASLGSTTSTDYSDSDRFSPQGTWYCYQVQTTHGEWTSQENNPSAAVQLGFVATSLQLTNGEDTSACGAEQFGYVDELDCGDQISVGFNQPVDPDTGPGSGDTVCADQNGTIWLGSSATSGGCASNEIILLGRLTGGAIENCDSRFDASYDWNDEHTVLIVTVGALVFGSYPTVSDSTWTLIPTDNTDYLWSDSGGHHICDTNADGGNCLPTADWMSGSSPRRDRLISEPTATSTPDVPTTITETPTSIATLDPTETLNPTDPAPTETPQTEDLFTPTPTPTVILEPTVEPPTVTLEPSVEPPAATIEPPLEQIPTSTP